MTDINSEYDHHLSLWDMVRGLALLAGILLGAAILSPPALASTIDEDAAVIKACYAADSYEDVYTACEVSYNRFYAESQVDSGENLCIDLLWLVQSVDIEQYADIKNGTVTPSGPALLRSGRDMLRTLAANGGGMCTARTVRLVRKELGFVDNLLTLETSS
jgi:hypothetical protein